MSTNPRASLLTTFINLQIAAESFLRPIDTPPESPDKRQPHPIPDISPELLVHGNNQGTCMPACVAKTFVTQWRVVDQLVNTTTGFSGTVFSARCDIPEAGINQNQCVISFRSTEFIDDAVRDNEMTNKLEVKEKGFAFGQITDMCDWITSLQHAGKLSSTIIVTGYSLGGHIATALNILKTEGLFPELTIQNTYTFNGAGVGEITGSSLSAIIKQFRAEKNTSPQQFSTKKARVLYHSFTNMLEKKNYERAQTVIQRLSDSDNTPDIEKIVAATQNILAIHAESVRTQKLVAGISQSTPHDTSKKLYHALIRPFANFLKPLAYLAKHIPLPYSNRGHAGHSYQHRNKPYHISTHNIAGMQLDYQLATITASQYTQPVNTEITLDSALGVWSEHRIQRPLAGVSGFYDIYADNSPSMVATSQIHHGNNVIGIRVEDQPLFRGAFIYEACSELLKSSELKLLVNNYDYNSFGDTHSIILLADACAVLALLQHLDPTFSRDDFAFLIQLSSVRKSDSGRSFSGRDLAQGEAEGDALDKIINSLWATLGITHTIATNIAKDRGIDNFTYCEKLLGDPNGGTWSYLHDANGYTGRERLHHHILILQAFIDSNTTLQQCTLSLPNISIRGDKEKEYTNLDSALSGNDFSHIVSLKHLNPLTIQPTDDIFWQTSEVWKQDYSVWHGDRKQAVEIKEPFHFSAAWILERNTIRQEYLEKTIA